MMKYKKIKIDHVIYIKVLYDVTVSSPTIYTDDAMNINNNETAFP